MKLILFLILLNALISACSGNFKNQVDRNFVECGLSEDSARDKKIVPLDFQIQKDFVRIFDSHGSEITDFEVSSKNCLIYPANSPATSIVYNNTMASKLESGGLHFKNCGSDCAVYPVCGFFEPSSDLPGSWVYAHISTQTSGRLNATINSESGSKAIDVTEKSCFKIDPTQAGLLNITDSAGNFVEKDIQDLLKNGSRQGRFVVFPLRSPLSKDELFCKENADYYKLVGDVCVVKDIRDYCLEGQPVTEKKRCDRLFSEYSSAEQLSFSREGKHTSTKYFSNLPNLKRLNLSGSRDLGSFREMKESKNIEELILEYVSFDISEIALFPRLKSLTISAVKENWRESPVFPNVKKLEISHAGHIDPAIFSKFPDVEELSIDSYNGGLQVLGELKHLKKLTIGFSLNNAIPDLNSLEDLKVYSLEGFVGSYPKLKTIEMKKPENLAVLSASNQLESFTVKGEYISYYYSDAWNASVFPSVRKVELDYFDSFKVLAAFPNAEVLDIKLSSSYIVKDAVSMLGKLRQLRRLKIVADHWDNPILKFDNLDFPYLEYLETTCNCEHGKLNLPNLETLVIDGISSTYEANLSHTFAPRLKSLTVTNFQGIKALSLPYFPELTHLMTSFEPKDFDFLTDKVPKLSSLKISIAADTDLTRFPNEIDALDVTETKFFDFGLLKRLPRLSSLKLRTVEDMTGSASDVFVLDDLDLTIYSQSDWDKVPKFVVKSSYKGPFNESIRKRFDIEGVSNLELNDGSDIQNISKYYSNLRNVRKVKLQSFEFDGFKGPIIQVFPALEYFGVDEFSLNGTQNRDLIDSLIGLKTEVIFGLLSLNDEEWYGLGCQNYFAEKNVRGDICSYAAFKTNVEFKYRPIVVPDGLM